MLPHIIGMKKLFFFLLLLIVLFPTSVSAHLAGQPPFFKINGVYSDLYDVPTSSFAEFKLPQDKPPALYVINEDIHFEIDTNSLPVPPEVVAISTFEWDWGDGSPRATGLQHNHRYTKAGSYFMEITAKTKDVSQPQLIQSTLIHIVPNKDYELPKAKILVNGQGTEDPLMDDMKIEFGKDFELDSGATVVGSAKIVEYLWDLGDGKSKKGERVTYQYGMEQYAFFPVLRVTDENGLFSDAFIQITNTDDATLAVNSTPTLVNHIHRNRYFIISGIVVGLLLVIGPFVFSKRRKS